MTVDIKNTESESASLPRLDGTVVKGLALIEFLALQEQPQGVSAIAQHFGWQKSNVHRLLTTFKALGYVRQDLETSRYELSLKTWELGMKVIGRSVVKRVALPFMRNLHRQFQETVNLSILAGTDVLYLETLLSSYPLRPTASPGARVPAVFTASGKSQLAFRPDASQLVDEILATRHEAAELPAASFMQELEAIRKQGYAISQSGWRTGVNSVAVPITNSGGVSIASIGISGPSERMELDRMREMALALMHSAAEIAEVCRGQD
ncbi:IclR family transcriptional regulator [Comamonas humi]